MAEEQRERFKISVIHSAEQGVRKKEKRLHVGEGRRGGGWEVGLKGGTRPYRGDRGLDGSAAWQE